MHKTLILLALLVLLTSCDGLLLGDQEKVASLMGNLEGPSAFGDGWEVSDLNSENVNANSIQHLIENLNNNPRNIHSLLIVKNGKLISESYFDGWNKDRLHSLRSDSKSFISTLIGIAIDQGIIKNVEQKVFDFFPEYSDLRNAEKNKLELKDVLTMTAGFQWDESTYFGKMDLRNDEYAVEISDDRLRYLFQKEMTRTPGSYFLYNSALPILQSAIIKKATGHNIDVFGKKYLFDPLSITDYYWRMADDGYSSGAPLFLRPRDMAKLGQLFLDGGKWKGKQIISSSWVSTATSSIVTNTSSFSASSSNTGYGYNWWTEKFITRNEEIQTFAAEGNGGQYIFVVPSLNAVVVFTGGNYSTNQDEPIGMMKNVILPAML